MDEPLCAVTYTRALGTNLYVLHLTQKQTVKEVDRNVLFEVMVPFYIWVSDILEKRTTPKTGMIKRQTSSREQPHVKYTCDVPLEKWCFLKMDEILTGLENQLTMKDILNRGLRMIIES